MCACVQNVCQICGCVHENCFFTSLNTRTIETYVKETSSLQIMWSEQRPISLLERILLKIKSLMNGKFTYLKSGCLYTLQYSFFEVFLLFLSKKQSEFLTLTPNNLCQKYTQKAFWSHIILIKRFRRSNSADQKHCKWSMVIMQFSGIFSPKCMITANSNLYVLIQQLHGRN